MMNAGTRSGGRLWLTSVADSILSEYTSLTLADVRGGGRAALPYAVPGRPGLEEMYVADPRVCAPWLQGRSAA